MNEADLEALILKEKNSQVANDARYMLGKNMIEGGFPDRVARNEKKGLNWIKEAEKQGHLPALEYKTYYDIRFEKHPSVEKILAGLERCAKESKSARACCTLAEFQSGQAKEEGRKEKAAAYYKLAADEGCIVGIHWMGVYYMEGFGVAQDLDKSEKLLLEAAKAGNG